MLVKMRLCLNRIKSTSIVHTHVNTYSSHIIHLTARHIAPSKYLLVVVNLEKLYDAPVLFTAKFTSIFPEIILEG
jgi:hypothetical protein